LEHLVVVVEDHQTQAAEAEDLVVEVESHGQALGNQTQE
jgi:hypothetical protein